MTSQSDYQVIRTKDSIYFGALHNGLKHGLGVLVTPHSLYEGSFSLNHKMGKGFAKFPNGSIYVGDFANNRPHGRGLLTFGEEYYMGDFANGAM